MLYVYVFVNKHICIPVNGVSFMLFSFVKKIASQFSFNVVFLRVLQRNRANCRYTIYMIYYKTLAC